MTNGFSFVPNNRALSRIFGELFTFTQIKYELSIIRGLPDMTELRTFVLSEMTAPPVMTDLHIILFPAIKQGPVSTLSLILAWPQTRAYP